MSDTDMRHQPPLPPDNGGLTPVEQHLGDRLAALIDGELGHDARERVLAHLATCGGCKTEADAQRRLKSVFADTAPPPPSDGLLARLQGLSGGGADGPPAEGGALGRHGDDHRTGHDERTGGPDGWLAHSRGGPADSSPFSFDYLPGGRAGSVLAPSRGLRFHDMDRSSSRGRRFAFVAAGAVSLAALALGGAFNSASPAGGSATAAGDGGPSASSVRTASSSSGASSDRDRRRRDSGDGTRAHGERGVGYSLTAPARGRGHAPGPVSRGPSRAGIVSPLLRNADFHPPLIGAGLPSAAYGPRGGAHRADMAAVDGPQVLDDFPGRLAAAERPAASPSEDSRPRG